MDKIFTYILYYSIFNAFIVGFIGVLTNDYDNNSYLSYVLLVSSTALAFLVFSYKNNFLNINKNINIMSAFLSKIFGIIVTPLNYLNNIFNLLGTILYLLLYLALFGGIIWIFLKIIKYFLLFIIYL